MAVSSLQGVLFSCTCTTCVLHYMVQGLFALCHYLFFSFFLFFVFFEQSVTFVCFFCHYDPAIFQLFFKKCSSSQLFSTEIQWQSARRNILFYMRMIALIAIISVLMLSKNAGSENMILLLCSTILGKNTKYMTSISAIFQNFFF